MLDSTSSAFDIAASAVRNGQAPASTSSLMGKKGPVDPEKLKASAQDFESFFLTSMMEQMFSGIETDGPFGGGEGERVFRSMLNQEYGKAIASSGGVGIADMVYRQMLALQEG